MTVRVAAESMLIENCELDRMNFLRENVQMSCTYKEEYFS